MTKLEELRADDPHGQWPRIVAVIDEFQYLFAERDAVAKAAGAARGHRAARPLAGHPPRAGQPGRVRHRGVLGPPGDLRAVRAAHRAAAGPPGARQDQRRATGAAALARRGQPRVRREARQPRRADPQRHAAPVDGGGAAAASRTTVRRLRRTADVRRQPGARRRRAAGGLGRRRSAAPRSARRSTWTGARRSSSCPMCPGRNVAVLGAGGPPPYACSAPRRGCSRASRRGRRGRDRPAGRRGRRAASGCRRASSATTSRMVAAPGSEQRGGLAGGGRRRAWSAATGRSVDWCSSPPMPRTPCLTASGTEALRKVLRFGPETGVHVLGWWRSVQRLQIVAHHGRRQSTTWGLGGDGRAGLRAAAVGARHAVLVVAAAGPGVVLRPRPACATAGRHRAVPRGAVMTGAERDARDVQPHAGRRPRRRALLQGHHRRDRRGGGEVARRRPGRAAALAVDLVGLEKAMLAAGERAALTHVAVELSWEDALEALWVQSWMQLHPRPNPGPRRRPGRAATAGQGGRAAPRRNCSPAVRRRCRPRPRRPLTGRSVGVVGVVPGEEAGQASTASSNCGSDRRRRAAAPPTTPR